MYILYCKHFFVFYRNLKNILDSIDTGLIAQEIYNQLCSTYVFPDIVSHGFLTILIELYVHSVKSFQLLMDFIHKFNTYIFIYIKQ